MPCINNLALKAMSDLNAAGKPADDEDFTVSKFPNETPKNLPLAGKSENSAEYRMDITAI
jgi:hypothetical protein